METSIRLATIGGIPIRAHFTFLLALPLLMVIFANDFSAAAKLAGIPPSALAGERWMWGLLVAIGLFVSVLVHELAHALYARARGARVVDITLLLIGGVSRIAEGPRRPRHEAIMALLGPVVSLLLALSFALLSVLPVGFNLQFAFALLGYLNLGLGLFNLLPAFPMDGGRILRASLAPALGRDRATRIAGTVGKVFAGLFVIGGLATLNLLLILVGAFVWLGAEGESRAVFAEEALSGSTVGDVAVTQLASAPGHTSVREAIERMVDGRRLAIPVIEDGLPVGVVTLADAERVPIARRHDLVVSAIARRVPAADAKDNLWSAFQRMSEAGLPELPVVSGGELVGVLRGEDVGRELHFREVDRKRAGVGWGRKTASVEP